MKRIVALFLVIAMAATFAFSVFADTQSEKDRLIKALENCKVTLADGSVITFKAEDINAAKNFLSAYDGEVTPDMVDEAIAKIEEAKAIVKATGVSDLKNLSKTQRQNIIEKADAAVEAFGLNATVNNSNGAVEFKDAATGRVAYETSSALKKTGLDVSPIYAVAGFVVIALVGCAVLTKKYALSK